MQQIFVAGHDLYCHVRLVQLGNRGLGVAAGVAEKLLHRHAHLGRLGISDYESETLSIRPSLLDALAKFDKFGQWDIRELTPHGHDHRHVLDRCNG